jgi:hypothetical protein
MVENNQHITPEKQTEKFGDRMRRGLFWVVQYWRELFNFKFDKYMIIQGGGSNQSGTFVRHERTGPVRPLNN